MSAIKQHSSQVGLLAHVPATTSNVCRTCAKSGRCKRESDHKDVCVNHIYKNKGEFRQPILGWTVKYRLEREDQILKQGYPDDAAFCDIPCTFNTIVKNGESKLLDTGLAVEIPKGHMGLIVGRSGNELGLHIEIGVIDSGYQGEIKVKVTNNTGDTVILGKNQCIAQLVIVPCPTFNPLRVDSFNSNTERGDRGFGSTGRG